MKNQTGTITEESQEKKTDLGQELLTVKSVEWPASGIYQLNLERRGIEFTPGDCLAVYDPDGQTSREYSIASGIHDPEISLLIRHMDDGQVTHHLSKLKAGDEIKCSLPYGQFHPGQHRDKEPFVFIATGTGISPFLSYMRSFPEKPPIKVLYGVQKMEDAVGYDVLKGCCAINLAVSREEVRGIWHGRVTGLLDTLPLDPKTHYYLCGLDAMVDDVNDWLESKGIEHEHIHREIFFYSSY